MSHWHHPGERHDITDYDDPDNILFTRWFVVGTPLFAVMVHKLDKSDVPTRGVHDHPWNFISFAFGTYKEVRKIKGGVPWIEPVHFFRFRRATDFHRVILVNERKPVWTLVIHGRRLREWGFLNMHTGAWQPWWALKKESDDTPDYHDRRVRSLRDHPSLKGPA